VTCRELVELVTDYFEDHLSAEERARFDEHLAMCEHCVLYVEQLRVTIRTVARIEPEGISAGTRVTLLGVFREWATLE
jgi:anti-sigma factor RsiW